VAVDDEPVYLCRVEARYAIKHPLVHTEATRP
jgi:hypothetical protein